MKYNKSEIMKQAWQIKRTWKERKTFGECLKMSWNMAKEKLTVEAYVVPTWLMHEKELWGVRPNVIKVTVIERETRKAFKAYGEWFPKSQCTLTRVAV